MQMNSKNSLSVRPYREMYPIDKRAVITEFPDEFTLGWVMMIHWNGGPGAIITNRPTKEEIDLVAADYSQEYSIPIINTPWINVSEINVPWRWFDSAMERDWYQQKLYQDHYLARLERLVLEAEANGVLLAISQDQPVIKDSGSCTIGLFESKTQINVGVVDAHINYATSVKASTILVSKLKTTYCPKGMVFEQTYVAHYTPGSDWSEVIKENKQQEEVLQAK